jgi:L-amino acid N-acyltransferase YncA
MSGRRDVARGAGRRFERLLLAYLAVAMLLAILPGAGAARPPNEDDYFAYEYVQEVNNGGGEYFGWWEKTESHGRYEVDAISGSTMTMSYDYTWTYDASDAAKTDPRRRVGVFNFSLDTRLYTHGYDLDVDYGDNPSVWLWVDPDVPVGTWVRILGDDFHVLSKDATVWSDWMPRKAMLLEARGSGVRHDAYGDMSYAYTDRYYMDRETGFVIAERYEEHDSGTWEGFSASFDWHERWDATSSSYGRPVDWLEFAGAIAAVAGVTFAVLYLAYRFRWRRRTVYYNGTAKAKMFRIWKAKKFPRLAGAASKNFDHFLEDFARKALLSGGRVGVIVHGDQMLGMAIYHRDVRMGVIFCQDWKLNEALRKYIGAKDFFSETMHEHTKSSSETVIGEPPAAANPRIYNIFETYRVLGLDTPQPMPYDSKSVRRMTEADLEAVAAISKKVYKARSRRWIRSLVDTGDIGFVATADGRIAGFAFMTVVGDRARFHSITVLPEFRGRGIGKELMRARLNAAGAFGVSSIVLEIADWNMPSLTISTTFGFRPIGSMYVETVRTKRVKKDIVRR